MISVPQNLHELPPAKGTIARALLSVFDKTGVVEFGRALSEAGVELLSSGGTARALAEAGVPVIPVDTFTGAVEVLGGRVKTLHPKIHAGVLADRRLKEHLDDLESHGYAPIDLVVCNLYPFEQTLKAGADHATAVENIDIGGPTLIRAAAKNADGGVTVLTSPEDYSTALTQIHEAGGTSLVTRRKLAAKAFTRIAQYDHAIATWANDAEATNPAGLPQNLDGFEAVAELRYGENPHQPALLHRSTTESNGVAQGTLLCGKALSYNNYLDMDAAWTAVAELKGEGCSVVKHTNTCGLSEQTNQTQAFRQALAGDPVSAFGSILGFNTPLTEETAKAIRETKLFVECIVAPGFTPQARAELEVRKNLRLFLVPENTDTPSYHAHRISGGMLVERADPGQNDPAEWTCVTDTPLAPGWLEELAFAMHAAANLKSNAITLTNQRSLLGCGAGQMSRVDACEQAIKKAGDGITGSFLGSDAFVPFDDCVRLAAAAGVVAIVQPGGSKRDPEVIAACNELGVAMVFTGRRHFRH